MIAGRKRDLRLQRGLLRLRRGGRRQCADLPTHADGNRCPARATPVVDARRCRLFARRAGRAQRPRPLSGILRLRKCDLGAATVVRSSGPGADSEAVVRARSYHIGAEPPRLTLGLLQEHGA
jgi:hypothetical protein